MARPKHTRCACCSTTGRYWYYELQWRREDELFWRWVGGRLCGACWSNLRSAIGEVGAGLPAIDG